MGTGSVTPAGLAAPCAGTPRSSLAARAFAESAVSPVIMALSLTGPLTVSIAMTFLSRMMAIGLPICALVAVIRRAAAAALKVTLTAYVGPPVLIARALETSAAVASASGCRY